MKSIKDDILEVPLQDVSLRTDCTCKGHCSFVYIPVLNYPIHVGLFESFDIIDAPMNKRPTVTVASIEKGFALEFTFHLPVKCKPDSIL